MKFDPEVAGVRTVRHVLDVNCRICRVGLLDIRACAEERTYLICDTCKGTQLTRGDLPSRDIEEQQYRLHRNDPDDPRYRAFVSRVVSPLIAVLQPGAEGLDYGCGDGPAGAALLRERGFRVIPFDPIFAPNPIAFACTYDFILCCEVVEHFHLPADEFDKFKTLLKPNGYLAIMTSFDTPERDFVSWHYRRDPTHVTFYREITFRHLAAARDWSVQFPAENVVLLQNRKSKT